MALNPEFVGRSYAPTGSYVVGREKLREFATAIGDGSPAYHDVEAARAALEKAYRDAGYLTVVVSIPEQDVSTGEVVLKVVEGTVERVRVRGAGFNLPSAVRAGVAELAEGTVPNFNTVQAQLAGVNRRADMRVTPVLRSGRLPGTVDVQLEVDDQLPLHGSLELNNRQTPNTTETRLSANVRYDNLFQRGHSVGLNWFYAPRRPDEANILSLNYHLPLGGRGNRVDCVTNARGTLEILRVGERLHPQL